MVGLMKRLRQEEHLKAYFFTRHSDPTRKVYSVRLGSLDSDEQANLELNSLLEKHGVLEGTKPYDCETWEVEGISINEIRSAACEMLEGVRPTLWERITTRQAAYLLHYLMNQLGFSLDEEYRSYSMLEETIKREL